MTLAQSSRGGSISLVVGRVLVVGEALFLALLATDEQIGVGWLIHLVPALVLAVCIAVTWRRPVVAGVCFLLLGLVTTVFFSTYTSLPAFVAISGPLLVGGLLLLIAARARIV